MRTCGAFALLLLLAACGGPRAGTGGPYAAVECVPYARQVSGLQLQGEADSWWRGAAGRYARGSRPVPGSVLVFRRSGRLPSGHVSVVRSVVSSREIRVDHANWVHHRIGPDDPVLDVSPANDWTWVRVWWAPSGALGSTTYAAYGFVGPVGAAPGRSDLAAALASP